MSALPASFAAAGGAPPPSHEVVRVGRDGGVRALVGTPWPGWSRGDEAGVYATRLEPQALAALADALAGLPGVGGPAPPDAGRFVLALADGRTLRWDPFAEVPAEVAAAAASMRGVLEEARRHPRAAVRLTLEERAGGLAFVFASTGTEPVTMRLTAPPRLRAVAAPGGSASDPPPLAWVREAMPLGADPPGPAELAPGERLTLEAPPPETAAGPHRLDGFASVRLDIPGGDGALDAVLAAGPLVRRA